jgi:hypothetical protein
MNNKNLSNRKDLISFRSFVRNKATSGEAALCDFLKSKNQPPRPQPAFKYFDFICGAATPPLKGGENIMHELNFNIKIHSPLMFHHEKPCSDSLA